MSFFKYINHVEVPKQRSEPVTSEENPFISNVQPSVPLDNSAKKSRKASTTKTRPGVQEYYNIESIDMKTCDILFVDEQIKKKLSSRISTLEELQKDLTKLLWISLNSQDPVDKIAAEKQKAILRRTIKDIEGGFDLAIYILQTADMLEEYRQLSIETKSNAFIQDPKSKNSTKAHRKTQIANNYIRIAKKYVKIENYKKKSQKIFCDACFSTKLRQSDDDSIYICQCGNEIEILDDAPTFKDAERVNMSSRYTYTCRGHFIEAMNRFEGKQNTEIPQKVIDIIKREMELHGLTRETITKDHIYMFLSENKLSDFYADINLIYFLVTSINPPDITNYRSELLEMLEQLEEAYKEVKDADRMNSLNVNWKLYKLLQILDYDCKKDDFFCLKTPTKQGEHEEKWRDMIDYLRSCYPDARTSKGKIRWRHIRTL
jgi:hypothetical protein